MVKEDVFDIVPGGGVNDSGKPIAKMAILKDGKPWVTSTTTYHTMDVEGLNKLMSVGNEWLSKKKLTGLNIHEVLKLEREAANFLVDLGEQVAKGK